MVNENPELVAAYEMLKRVIQDLGVGYTLEEVKAVLRGFQ